MPNRFAPILFGLLLSGIMSLVVSGLSTARAAGLSSDFAGVWMTNWLYSWCVAFPTVLVLAPAVRRLVTTLVKHPEHG